MCVLVRLLDDKLWGCQNWGYHRSQCDYWYWHWMWKVWRESISAMSSRVFQPRNGIGVLCIIREYDIAMDDIPYIDDHYFCNYQYLHPGEDFYDLTRWWHQNHTTLGFICMQWISTAAIWLFAITLHPDVSLLDTPHGIHRTVILPRVMLHSMVFKYPH